MGNAPLPVKSLPVEKSRGISDPLRSNQGGPDYTLIHALIAQLSIITLKYRQPKGPKALTVRLFAAGELFPPAVARHG
jgi:hypothetical protein